MKVLTDANVIPEFTTRGPDPWGAYSLRNVDTGDTIDMATLGPPNWQVIKRAVVMGISDFVELAADFTGTVVTMPAGMSKTSGVLVCWGC